MNQPLVKPYWIDVRSWGVLPEGLLDAFRKNPGDHPNLAELAAVNQDNPRLATGLLLIPGGWSEPKDGPAWENMVPFKPDPTPCSAGETPRKAYRYRVQPGDKPWTIAEKFGQPYSAWVKLRQANHDDPAGFSRPAADSGVCSFSEWNPGKFVRIPAAWPDPGPTSDLWKCIDSSYPTGSADAGTLGEPFRGPIMIRHQIQRGETSGSIARAYGVTKDALFAANPQLAKTTMFGERDFAKEHFKADGVLNVPNEEPRGGTVGAPDGTVGCGGGGCGMGANPWRNPRPARGTTQGCSACGGIASQPQAVQQRKAPPGYGWARDSQAAQGRVGDPDGSVGCGGGGAGCGCGGNCQCKALGPAPMCIPNTDPGWNPSFPWGVEFADPTWNPSFPWGNAMGVQNMLQPPPWAGPGCSSCGSVGAPSDGTLGAVCPNTSDEARPDVRYIIPSGKYPGDVAAMFGYNPQQDGSAGAIRDANQPWGPGCEKTSAGDTVLSAWAGGKKIKLPMSFFGPQEEQWAPAVYANLRMFDPATQDWTAPYVKNSMPPATGGCKAGQVNIAGTCYALPVGVTLPVGGQCPSGTTDVGGYCIPSTTTGYPPILGLPGGCLPGTILQGNVCVIPGVGPGTTTVTGVPPVAGACPAGTVLYSNGLCYPSGKAPAGLTPVGYEGAKKDEGWPTWAYALIGVGVAGAAVLLISAASKKTSTSTVKTTRTMAPAHGGAGEVVVVDEGGAAHGRRLLPATSRRSSRPRSARKSR